MINNMNERIFNTIPTKIFLAMLDNKDQNIANIARIANQWNRSHLQMLLKKFHKNGLVSREKKGRVVIVNLTTKGYEIATKIRLIMKILGEENGTKS